MSEESYQFCYDQIEHVICEQKHLHVIGTKQKQQVLMRNNPFPIRYENSCMSLVRSLGKGARIPLNAANS